MGILSESICHLSICHLGRKRDEVSAQAKARALKDWAAMVVLHLCNSLVQHLGCITLVQQPCATPALVQHLGCITLVQQPCATPALVQHLGCITLVPQPCATPALVQHLGCITLVQQPCATPALVQQPCATPALVQQLGCITLVQQPCLATALQQPCATPALDYTKISPGQVSPSMATEAATEATAAESWPWAQHHRAGCLRQPAP
jgi:hypothetical protein